MMRAKLAGATWMSQGAAEGSFPVVLADKYKGL